MKFKQKGAVYLSGNNDPATNANHTVHQTNQWTKTFNSTTFIITHGHQQHSGLQAIVTAFPPIAKIRALIFGVLFRIIEPAGIKQFGQRFSQLFFYRRLDNNALKHFVDRRPKHEFWIFGHTHLAEIDRRRRFANCGEINHGHATWIEINHGVISLQASAY